MPNPPLSRRDLIITGALAATLATSASTAPENEWSRSSAGGSPGPDFRVRTLTAGVPMKHAGDIAPIESALQFLRSAQQRMTDAGYAVQTVRIATSPFMHGASAMQRENARDALRRLDGMAADAGAMLSIGPVNDSDTPAQAIADWIAAIVGETRASSFSLPIASTDRGIDSHSLDAAALTTMALSRVLPDGSANFRFAAAACVPAGTPFFPVAWHESVPALAVGLETPNLVRTAFTDAANPTDGATRLQGLLNRALAPVERIAQSCAREGQRRYLGIDTSPAPGADASIGAAIEALTRAPFGSPGTLQACAAITGAIKALRVKMCGYSGLMLPILEDPVLAARADEGRITVNELLLYSSVCGTGLDVVPLAGDVSLDAVRGVLGDVATMALRLRKPLAARLFPMPGKSAGDRVSYSDPLLFPSKVLPL